MNKWKERLKPSDSRIDIDFSDAKHRLVEGLRRYHHPQAERLLAILDADTTSSTVNLKVGAKSVKDQLTAEGHERANGVKSEYRRNISSSYPQAYDNQELQSPGNYVKANPELGGTHRPELRHAYSQTVQRSKVDLLRIIDQDTLPSEAVEEYLGDEEMMNGKFKDFIEVSRQKIHEYTEAIETLLPQKRPRGVTGYVMRRSVQYEETSTDPKALNDNLERLATLLAFTKGGTNAFVVAVKQSCQNELGGYVDTRLNEHYAKLIQENIKELSETLPQAYKKVVEDMEATSMPKSVTAQISKRVAPAEVVVESGAEPRESETFKVQESTLGEINSPFPWSSDERTPITLLRSNGDSLLYCQAFSPLAVEISERLRTHSPTNDRFSAFIERIKGIELSNQGGHHPAIKGARDVKLENLTIRYFSQIGPNGMRVYYARTVARNYPEVSALAEAQGMSSEAPLLIILAETDKAHQLDIFEAFGMDRRQARKWGVGSI